MNKYISRKSAAEMLGIAYHTLMYWERSGHIIPIIHPVNGRSFYTEEIIENFMIRFKSKEYIDG